MEPVTVIVAEPLAPPVIVKPDVVDSFTVPCVTVSVSDSEPLPGPESATVTALLLAAEKTSVPFRTTEPEPGAEIVGGLKALIVRATLFAADWLSPGSVIE